MKAKYINAEKLKSEIDKIIEGVKRNSNPNPLGTIEDCLADAEIETLGLVKDTIDEMTQDEPMPPGIEEESQKKGWLDYGLMMSEIGLHRYNANHRIRENKEVVEKIKREIAPAHLARLCEYSEAVGVEITCMCLQQYGMDFMFTQDEVKEIIEKESR